MAVLSSGDARMGAATKKDQACGKKGNALPPIVGIVVASTSRDGHEHGRPVLLALRHTLSLLQGMSDDGELPFLFLAGTTGCLQYHYDHENRAWRPAIREPSAVAAQKMCREYRGNKTEGRLLLVNLGHRGSPVHPALLPWLTLFSHGNQSITPVLLNDLMAIMANESSTVVDEAFAGDGGNLDGMLQKAWSCLMTGLDHREQR